MLKVENNLGDLTPPLPLFFSPSSFIPLHFILHLLLSSFTRLSAPLLSLLHSPPEWPDASNFMTVDVFTFLQSLECMNIYDTGLSLWGICLYSLLIYVCVSASVRTSIIFSWFPCVLTLGFCVHQPYISCIFLSASIEDVAAILCVCVCMVWYCTTDSSAPELVPFLLSVKDMWVYVSMGKDRTKKKKKANQYFMRAKTSRHTHFIFSLPKHCL